MPKTVVAYTTSWCPDCTRSRRLLRALGVPFQEIDIEETPGSEDEMRRINGGSGRVPTIVIDGQILIEPSDADLRAAIEEDD